MPAPSATPAFGGIAGQGAGVDGVGWAGAWGVAEVVGRRDEAR